VEKSVTDAESKQSLIDRLQKALEKERSAAKRDDKAVSDVRKQNDNLMRDNERIKARYEDLSDRGTYDGQECIIQLSRVQGMGHLRHKFDLRLLVGI
jgi:hypothetical protein